MPRAPCTITLAMVGIRGQRLWCPHEFPHLCYSTCSVSAHHSLMPIGLEQCENSLPHLLVLLLVLVGMRADEWNGSKHESLMQRPNFLPRCRIAIYTSPMIRACQTAKAASNGIPGVQPQLHPDLYEVGGMYKAVKGPSGKFEKQAANARPAADVAGQFGFGIGKCSKSPASSLRRVNRVGMQLHTLADGHMSSSRH